MVKTLEIDMPSRMHAEAAGLFVSRGQGRHPQRETPFYDLIFVTAGELGMQEDAEAFTVRAGEMVLLWPGCTHWGTQDYQSNLTFYWLHFVPVEPFAGAPPDPEDALSIPQFGRVRRPERLQALFDHYLEDTDGAGLTPSAASALLSLILREIADASLPAGVEQASTHLAVRTRAFIRAHCMLPLSASYLAAEFGFNADYLARIYHMTYGETVTEAIHRHRISNACHMLVGTNCNVGEISRLCGFAEPGYFRRLFKGAKGVTPLAYRRRHSRVYINTG